MNSPYQVSEETLGMSTMQRGLPGMVSKVAPGPNMYDQGAESKLINSQPASTERLKYQEYSRNIESAGPQAAAGATQDFRKQVLNQSDAEAKAQKFAAERKSEVLYANDMGTKIMELNSVLNGVDRNKYLYDIAGGKAMTQGMNPDLGMDAADRARYRA